MNMMRAASAQSAFFVPIAGGVILLAATALLVPNRLQIADAVRRATFSPPPPSSAALLPTSAVLMQRFSQGNHLSPSELEQLLRASLATSPGRFLSMIASRLEKGGSRISTAQITYDILAQGRAAEALAFLESRPDAGAASLWRLRFELRRKTGDAQGARSLLSAAARTPGVATPHDLVSAAYALAQPDILITAAERGVMPRLDRAQSLDLANWASEQKRHDLFPRIDRIGTASWRDDNPWLAMTIALHQGDVPGALRYADRLPTGAESAREAIVLGSGDRNAIRRLFLEKASSGKNDRAFVAEQLLDRGFRAEAISVLKAQSGQKGTGDAASSRMLYLMGPRPLRPDLEWLRSQAFADRRWLGPYLEREQPARALAFLEGRPEASETGTLLQRITLAHEAHDDAGAARALDQLLDGRPLSRSELKVAALALTSRAMARRYGLTLTKARVRSGAEAPADRLELAWDFWNRGEPQEAADQLTAYLERVPDDAPATQLMASVQAKLGGKARERPWLERLLMLTPDPSRERATILARLDRQSEAISLLERLRQQSPDDRLLKIQLSRLLVSAGNPGRARKVLQP